MDKIQFAGIGYDVKRSELDVIKTNLLLNSEGKQVIAILSTAWTENVPKLTLQLAESFALGQRKALLINIDGKNEEILNPASLQDDAGLYSLLSNEYGLQECINETDIPGLSYLPAGPHDDHAVDLLGGTAFSNMLQQMREQYDIIFLLVPAIADSTEGIAAAKSADGCVVITRSDTAYSKIAKSITMLRKGTPVIGSVLVKDRTPWMPSLKGLKKGKK